MIIYTSNSTTTAGKHSIWSDVGNVVGTVVSIPFRTSSTVVNGGVFAAYYVTNLATTSVAASLGFLYGGVRIAVDTFRGNNSQKSLYEYSITPAKITFNFIARFYNEIPDHASEKIFAAAIVIATLCAEIFASRESSNSSYSSCSNRFFYGGQTVNNYYICSSPDVANSFVRCPNGDDSFLSRIFRPYKIATNLGAGIMRQTTYLINGRNV